MSFLRNLFLSSCVLGAACASEVVIDEPEVEVGAQTSELLWLTCRDSVDSVYEKPRSLLPLELTPKGEVLRCAQGEAISRSALNTALDEANFPGVDALNGVRIYRISYRTQRPGRIADVSSALVAIPDQSTSLLGSLLTGIKRPPVIVYAHGTGPYRQDCGYSRSNPLTAMFEGLPDLELRTFLALASQGSPVIMPDYAGYVAGSAAPGYIFSEDEAYSVLDATRAVRKLTDDASDQVVMVGHSQGGHAVLSAQSYARSYGLSGKLSGVVAYAPFWAPARTFGFIISPDSGYVTSDPVGAYALNAAVEYFYTHAEVIDGKGAGQNILTFNIADLIGTKGTECKYFPDISQFGTVGTDLFKPEFAAVANCALLGEDCDNPTAVRWAARFAKDRPALDPAGAPVLLWQGAQDAVVPNFIAGCGIDKLNQDFASAPSKIKVCADPSADHELIESNNAAYVLQWIKARTQGGAEPSQACGNPAILEASCVVGNFD